MVSPSEGWRSPAKRDAGDGFARLSTNKLHARRRGDALAIYRRLFPGCEFVPWSADPARALAMDRDFSIDGKLVLPTGQYITVQEKFREHKFLSSPFLQVEAPFPDFTQEHLNACGTAYEAPGEFYKLAAQVYFYGWEDAEMTGFAKWVMLDIARYKMIVERAGGLEAIGQRNQNSRHGRASFFCIPVNRLREAFLFSHAMTEPLQPYPAGPARAPRFKVKGSGQPTLSGAVPTLWEEI